MAWIVSACELTQCRSSSQTEEVDSISTTPTVASGSSEPGDNLTEPPQYLEVESLYDIVGYANGIAVDAEWIYFQGSVYGKQMGTFRAPKRAGSDEDIELIGPHTGDTSGEIIVSEGNEVFWSTSDLVETSKLHIFHKNTGLTEELDLGFTTPVMSVVASPTKAVALPNNCVGALVVDRDTLETHRISRADAEHLGGLHSVQIYEDDLYCSDERKLWRSPLTGDSFELVAETAGDVIGIFPWDDTRLLLVGKGSEGEVELFETVGAPHSPEHVGVIFEGTESEPMYSPAQQAIYFVSRYLSVEAGHNFVALHDTSTWETMRLPLPYGQVPANGITQDEEYLYWGERLPASFNFVYNNIVRWKKLSAEDVNRIYIEGETDRSD